MSIAEDTAPPSSLWAGGDATPISRHSMSARLAIENCREHVPALRIGSAFRWARGECGRVPTNFLSLRTVRYRTESAFQPYGWRRFVLRIQVVAEWRRPIVHPRTSPSTESITGGFTLR